MVATLALCSAFGIVAAWWPREQERRYGAQRLSYWVRLYARGDGGEPAQAIRTIGPRAVPFLLKWINYDPLDRRAVLGWIYRKLPAWVRARKAVERAFVNPDRQRLAYGAAMAFHLLGSDAQSAVPALAQLTTRSTEIKTLSLMALGFVGGAAAPVFARHLSTPNAPDAADVVNCVRFLGTNAAPLAPLLLEQVGGTNEMAASLSAHIVGELKLQPAVAVPRLVQYLADTSCVARASVATALGDFGARAARALPALTNALSDPDAAVRLRTSEAIARIHLAQP